MIVEEAILTVIVEQQAHQHIWILYPSTELTDKQKSRFTLYGLRRRK